MPQGPKVSAERAPLRPDLLCGALHVAHKSKCVLAEYFRAGLLPAADAMRTRAPLKSYLQQRIRFYNTRDDWRLDEINASTARLQSDLQSAVKAPAPAQLTPTVTLAVSGMNDVLNAQGHAQAAWWNRIPVAAWGLMGVIAMFCNLLVGFNAQRADAG